MESQWAGADNEDDCCGSGVVFFFSLISAYPTAANAEQEEGPLAVRSQVTAAKFIQLTTLIGRLNTAGDQQTASASNRPPLKPGMVAKEALFGIGAGFIGLMVGGFIGVGITGAEAGWFEPDTTVGAAAATGYCLALPWGVYLTGSDATQTGSLLATYLGTAAGAVIAIVVPSFSTALLAPVAGACIGFNLTRRYRPPAQTGTALLNFNNGRITAGFPIFVAAPDPMKKGAVRWRVNLVSIEL